jgi:hypothetical protein
VEAFATARPALSMTEVLTGVSCSRFGLFRPEG